MRRAANAQSLIPFRIKRFDGEQWVPCAPVSSASQVILRDETTLADCLTDCELAALEHGLDAYPHVLVLLCRYGAGIGGAGETPAGGRNAVSVPCKIEYLDRSNLKIYVSKSVAVPDRAKTVERVSGHEYVVTTDDSPESVYIRLILI